MKIDRTRNASRNIIFGGILKIYQLVIPFVMRTIIIYFLGPGYAGLNSLFTSILQVLNLAELGVGSAMIFSMYKPIAEDDTGKICALMKLYQLYYRIIGVVIAIIGCLLLPFIPHLIKRDLPDNVNIYILYILNLTATVLTYWLFAYKNSILTAHQRQDISSKITLVTDTVKYILQIAILVFLKDYYLYVIIILLSQIVTNIVTAIVSDRMYPIYKPHGKISDSEVKLINGRIRDLFTSKIGSVIVNSADSIVISAFLGLTMLAIYQNYFFIVSAIIGIITIIFTSCSAGVGNSLITETLEKNFNDLKKFSFFIIWITSYCSCCFLSLMQPFMNLWMGEDLMLRYSAVICLTIYFFIYEINMLLNMYKDAAGLWHEDRFRPLVTALSNLIMNIIMVQFWNIYGVILSTVLSTLFIGLPWLLHNLFSVLFTKKQLKEYLTKMIQYILISVIVIACTSFFANLFSFSIWPTLIIRLILCTLLTNGMFILIYRKSIEFNQCMQIINKIIKLKIPLLSKYE